MINLKRIKESDLKQIYKIEYQEEFPFWAEMNAPYFDEYRQVDFETFLKDNSKFYLWESNLLGIFIDDEIIGTVSAYWESEVTRWLEVGILIFSSDHHHKGYGSQALAKWIEISLILIN